MSAISEKVQTVGWFLQRPSFWPHMAALAKRKLDGSAAHDVDWRASEAWAAERAMPILDALQSIGALKAGSTLPPALDPQLITAGEQRAKQAKVDMGGPGDLDLIHQAIVASGARKVVETGVAYGWSSLAALAALEQTGGQLVSVDMPYPKANNEEFVGIVVPQEWRHRWTLIRQPDRNGLKKALLHFGGTIDLAHFDSDKSYAGRMFAFPLIWAALRPGGLFISDDIQDNFGFRDFCEREEIAFAVTESDGKFVGICRKPEA